MLVLLAMHSGRFYKIIGNMFKVVFPGLQKSYSCPFYNNVHGMIFQEVNIQSNCSGLGMVCCSRVAHNDVQTPLRTIKKLNTLCDYCV